MEETGGRLVTCVSHSEPLFSFQDVLRSKNNTYSAAPSVATGVSSAFVDLDLTAGPSEARLAGTGVAALTSVATSGSIHAGLVVSAVVEIWKDTANTCGLATAQHMAGQQQRRQNVFFVLRHTRLFLFFQCFFFFVSCLSWSLGDNCSSVVVSLPQRRRLISFLSCLFLLTEF